MRRVKIEPLTFDKDRPTYIVANIEHMLIEVTKCDDGFTGDSWEKTKFKLLKTKPGKKVKIGDKVFCNANVKSIGQDWVIGETYTITSEISASGSCRAKGTNWNDIENFVVLVEDNKQFNSRILSEDIVVNCRTQEQAINLLNWADDNDKRWSSGDRFTQFTNWTKHFSDTCYIVKQGFYNNIEYHDMYKHNIWSYEDALCINTGI